MKQGEPQQDAPSVRLGWTLAWVFALLALSFFVYASWRSYANPTGVDFAGFWAAGFMAVKGTPALAYDVQAHGSVALSLGVKGLLPFAYPPSFLLILAPFALVPFPMAFTVWGLATGSFYLRVTQHRVPLPYSLALPPVIPNLIVGQNGFLFTGVFAAAAELIETQPWLAGVLFGLLAVKPQIGVLIPFALAAGGHWKALAGAAISATGLAIAAALCFGSGTYFAFLRMLPYLTQLMGASQWPWHKLASVLAFARYVGVDQGAAMAIQGLAACVAAVTTWRAWQHRNAARVPILATATILVPPYLFTYDALLLIVPFGWLLQHKCSGAATILWLGCLPPVLGYLGLYNGPNTVPVAAAITLFILLTRRWPTCNGVRTGCPKHV